MTDTGVLLARVRSGDRRARDELFARYLPILTRWARHRLPRQSRDLRDTEDLVQDTLVRALGRIEAFEYRGEGAFLGYLRQILFNAIRDSARRAQAVPERTTLDDAYEIPAPSPLEEAIGRERLDQFESALDRLAPEPRLAVILRIEFGMSHQQVADALGKSSAEAARSLVARAMVSIARAMGKTGEP